jgi:hypothetical protein
LWDLNFRISLKDAIVIEIVRGAVLWAVWLERNKIVFISSKLRSLKCLALQIISLASFWCLHTSNGNLRNLSLVLPQNTYDLCMQVSGTHHMVLATQILKDLVEVQNMVLALPPTFESACDV